LHFRSAAVAMRPASSFVQSPANTASLHHHHHQEEEEEAEEEEEEEQY
jgi:ribosomal protein L12E/L44/L45/RPP1/RPP2